MLSLIKGALGAVKGSWVNIALVLAVVSAISGFVVYYDKSRYNAGYNAAVVKMAAATQVATEASAAAFKLELSNALANKRVELTEANRTIQELLRRPTDVIVKEITKVVESSECKRIGAEPHRLLNEIINTARPTG